MFDAQQYLESLEPATFRDPKGRLHIGRVLSYQEWLPFQDRMRELSKGESSPEKTTAIIREFCGALFPKPWWKFWRRSVAEHILMLPPPAAIEALQSFSQSQAKILTANPSGLGEGEVVDHQQDS
jgi:hypothetical protein